MAKFFYKMQNILEIKYKMEEQAKANYAVARQQLDKEELELVRLKEKKYQYECQVRDLMTGILDMLEMKSCMSGIEKMKMAIKDQKIRIQVAEKKLELARQKLSEVMIERKTHEKLKEHAFEEFIQEINKEENKEIDQLVSYNFSKIR